MNKSKSAVSSIAFASLTAAMLIALSTTVLASYPGHVRSMVIGTLAYIFMSGIVVFSKQNNKQAGIAGALASLTFVGAHVLIEASLFSSIGMASVTNPFGYAAIAAFLLAGFTYVVNKVRHLAQLTLYINGLMTAGITLVYYHVASLAPIRGSLLFFIHLHLYWLGRSVNTVFKCLKQSAHADKLLSISRIVKLPF